MSEKPLEFSEMSELVWASQTMRDVIAPAGSAGSKGERIRLCARLLGWAFSRTKDVWYADPRVSLKPKELRTIEEVSGVLFGRREAAELAQLIERADALLEGNDPDFYRPFRDALREVIRVVARART